MGTERGEGARVTVRGLAVEDRGRQQESDGEASQAGIITRRSC